MHPEALAWVVEQVEKWGPFYRVAEFGSLNVNGGVRHLFGEAFYLGVDRKDGPGVDVVADACTVQLEQFDCVVSTEVLEHYERPLSLIKTARYSLRQGGVLIATAAGPDRTPHGADGGPLMPWEHYANIDPRQLDDWLSEIGFIHYEVNSTGQDVRCWAVR